MGYHEDFIGDTGSLNLLISYCIVLIILIPVHVNAAVYRIGPAQQYQYLRQIQWDSLNPGDIVEIHSRPEPYREKFVVKSSGTKKRPIIIKGIPDAEGKLPVIDGSMAVNVQTKIQPELARRAIIIVGGSESKNGALYSSKDAGDYIVIKALELRNANNTNFFYLNGTRIQYAANGAGVYVQKGRNVVIMECIIHSCCMGVQTAYYPNVDNFLLSKNIIYNNGDFTRTHWGHNVYLGSRKSIVEFNRFGELYSDGNNIKDRSEVIVIRYNWIEGGMSRQIDLVETRKYPTANAYVYGNVIISGEKTKNPKMVLFGGDTGEHSSRKGTLYFFNNTVHFKKMGLHAFIWVNRPDCKAILMNNLFLGGKNIWSGTGRVTGMNNMIEHGSVSTGLTSSFFGSYDQIWSKGNIPYFPRPNSLLLNRGISTLPAKVQYIPMPMPEKRRRPVLGALDIGAFEFQ